MKHLKNMQPIEFRPMTDDDMETLYQVYADTRVDEILKSGWTMEEIDGFLRKQFQLQHLQYVVNYKGARFDLILYDKQPVGRLYVHRKKDDIRIIDIALLREFRRKGIGSRIMKALIREADEKQLPLSLHVEQDNPAMCLYERLGFQKGDLSGIYYFMKRPPAAGRRREASHKTNVIGETT